MNAVRVWLGTALGAVLAALCLRSFLAALAGRRYAKAREYAVWCRAWAAASLAGLAALGLVS